MKLPTLGILRTTSFRIAGLYALLYALLAGVIVMVVFAFAEHEIHTQLRTGLIDESTALTALLQVRGPDVLEKIIEIRSAHEPPDGEVESDNPDRRYYVLATAANRVLVGDLEQWPKKAPATGWVHFRVKRFGPALGLVTPLSGDRKLLVAQSLAGPDALSAAIGRWVIVGAILALAAGVLGGLLVGARIMRHINRAGRAAERIQFGRLDERLPSGGSTEYATLARTFNAMLERIETAVVGLRDLGVRTAHEMRSPLARADQALERAEGRAELPEVAAEIRAARAQLSELATRNKALLRLAQLESHTAHEFFVDFDLAQLVADVVDLYSPLATERDRALVLADTGSVEITGDRQLLGQALANLLDNAIKYAPPGPIDVCLRATAKRVAVEVRDTGEGTTPETASHGSGLGLPIARAIAQLHGGKLEFVQEDTGFRARLVLTRRPGRDADC